MTIETIMNNRIQTKDINFVKRLAGELFSEPVFCINPITKGGVNKVFAVKTQKMNLIVRIHKDQSNIEEYQKEKLCMEKVSKLGVPVPKVIELGNQIIPYAYMIYEYIEGISADEYQGDKLKIWRQIGKYAVLINSMKTYGYGYNFEFKNKQKQNKNSYEKWKIYIDEKINGLLKCKLFIEHKVIERKDIPKIKNKLESIKRWRFEPKLNHGNLSLKNTVVDKSGKVVAILDWGEAASHPTPSFEFATTIFWITPKEEKAFLDGYGISMKEYEFLKLDVERLELLQHLGSAHWHIQRKNYKALEYIKQRLHTIIC